MLISDSIVRRLAVDEIHVNRIRIILAVYYINNFDGIILENDDNSDAKILRLASRISMVANLETKYIISEIDKLKANGYDFSNLAGVLKTLSANIDSARLQNLSVGQFSTLISGQWYGSNASEQVAVALEHMPTWIAMVYAAISNPSGKMGLYKYIALNDSRKDARQNFVDSMTRYMKSHGVNISTFRI
jgi:hypothetical protein